MVAYGRALGVRSWYRSKIAEQELFHAGEPTEIDWDIVVGSSGRVQVELIETKVYGLNLGMPEWLLKVGRLTGDVERLSTGKER